MKKNILILLILLLFTSCFNNNIVLEDKKEKVDINKIVQNNDIIENNKEEENLITGISSYVGVIEENSLITQEEFFELEIPKTFELNQDLLFFLKILDNDISFFEQERKKDLHALKAWRANLFGEYQDEKEIYSFLDCINWVKNSYPINGDYKEVCKWENKFIELDNNWGVNFFHIKDQFIKFKEVYEWKEKNCSYFDWTNYDFPEFVDKHLPWDNLLINYRNDYLICNKLKNIKSFSLKKELFYYNTALRLNKCSFLKDKVLLKICNEEYKVITK